jgi:8-oxo-dGTP diphosphatase
MKEGIVLNQSVVDIHTDYRRRTMTPHAVLVFPVFRDSCVWVRHHQRGWEVPGGKVEPGESPELAAVREVHEEAGLLLGDMRWVAEYQLVDAHGISFKSVFFATVQDAKARSAVSETTDVRVFRPNISPSEAKTRADVSFIMKDAVYDVIWPLLQQYIADQKGRSR